MAADISIKPIENRKFDCLNEAVWKPIHILGT